MLLVNEYTSKHNVGAVCSEEETDLIIQGQDRRHRQHTVTTSLMGSPTC